MNIIKYTKVDGDTSVRPIYPFGVLDAGADNVKIQAIDFSGMTDTEMLETEILLTAIRKEYLQKIYDLGLKSKIRSFFFKQIEYR
jgi:hypothetical protein